MVKDLRVGEIRHITSLGTMDVVHGVTRGNEMEFRREVRMKAGEIDGRWFV